MDQTIINQLNLINDQEECMFTKDFENFKKPDFKLVVPEALTQEIYYKITKKIYS